MNSYALTVLLKTDLDDKACKQLLSTIAKKFDKVKKEDLWGVRDLAYPIRRQNRAYYAHFELEAEPSKISDIDKNLKLEEDILRYLLVRI